MSRAKLHMKINKLEREIEVHVIRNDNFSHDLLLGIDAIKKFKLIQDENLEIPQKVEDETVEKLPREENQTPSDKSNHSNIVHVNSANEYLRIEDTEARIDYLSDEMRQQIMALTKNIETFLARVNSMWERSKIMRPA